MSAELGIITAFLGGAFLLVKLASDRRGEMDTETAPDFIQSLYLLVSYAFVLGALFAASAIASNNSYPQIANVLDWALTLGILPFILLGALYFYDFVSKVMKAVNNGDLDDSDWGW